jgi:DNA repair exonuclease SbcCD ATPase subunit
MYNSLRVQKDASVENEKQAKNQLNDINDEMDRQKTERDKKDAAHRIEVGQLDTKLKDAERQKAALIDEAGKWKAITREFYDTNDKQRQLLEDTLAKLKTIEADQIQSDKEFKETTAALIEKMAIIDDLEKQSKQLLEEKTDLQNRLNQLLQQAGKVVAAPERVTTVKEKAQVAPPTVDIGLDGLITSVDLQNSLAEISIGAANGVKQNMRFHVTRADKFICDIVILDVEPEKAIGTLKLMDVTNEQPKADDNVSTNL